MSVYFYNEALNALPEGTKFYFNVVVVRTGISPEFAKEVFPGRQWSEMWLLDRAMDIFPIVNFLYINNTAKGKRFYSETSPHCVVGVAPDGEVFWWNMLEFAADRAWEIPPPGEDWDWADGYDPENDMEEWDWDSWDS